MSTARKEEREWSIAVTVLTEPGVSRRRAEQIARSIQRFAEARPGVSHAYQRDVYDLDEEDEAEGR